MRRSFSCLFFLALFLFAADVSLLAEPEPAADERPNIIVILSDDMGFSDLGCYGGEIRTPTLDRLAQNGLRFTQFYNTGRCCPTRASLLTGLYPHQAGIGHMVQDRGHPGYRGTLNESCVTIAEALRPAGYGTYAVGKWHVVLDRDEKPDGDKRNWPLQRGFDRYYGTIQGAGSYYDPAALTRGNTMISALADPEYTPKRFYYPDAISDHASKFIREHHENTPERPFFLYVAYPTAHWPLHALEEDIEKYRGAYDDGYDAIRKRRIERLRELGIIPPDLEPSPTVGDWEKVEHREWEIRCMEVYAAMIDRMDQGIGRIVRTLEETGKLENTLILYLQDNGGCQETIGRQGDWMRPVAPSLPPIPPDKVRLGTRPKQNRAGVPTLTGPHILPGPEDTYIAYGLEWANVSNTPFREYKHFVHEGGISTPLIAHWPKGIRRGGELERQPGHLIDIMATLIELAGAKYPEKRGEHDVKPMEGTSLKPAFAGKPLARKAPLFWEHEGNRAIRDGRYKLVAKEDRAWELYDLEKDRSELENLAAAKPEVVRELDAKWNAWAERAHVLPLGTWRAPRTAAFNKDQMRFELEAGGSLEREEAPYFVGRTIDVRVEITKPGAKGVLVAQGGSADGWSLYVVEGEIRLAVRRDRKLLLVRAKEKPAEPNVVTARIGHGGEASIAIDGREVAREKMPGLFDRFPIDGLEVGVDHDGAVGEYRAPNAFTGTIEKVVIELGEPASAK